MVSRTVPCFRLRRKDTVAQTAKVQRPARHDGSRLTGVYQAVTAAPGWDAQRPRAPGQPLKPRRRRQQRSRDPIPFRRRR